MVLIDGKPAGGLPFDDRGLAYGDGLFETVRIVAGRAPLWPGHMSRLRRGAARLRLPLPPPAAWLADARRMAGRDDCVLKLMLTRHGGRGYGPDAQAGSRRIVLRYPLPVLDPALHARGLRLRWCRLRLARQPLLAGMKHLNRLEQVLARAEWRDPRIDEGLLLDDDGRVIGATSANLFLVRDGRLLTPRLTGSGVAGVARAWLLHRARRWLPVLEADLRPQDLATADEVFLSNAVRGVQPVRALGSLRWPIGPVTRRLGRALAALGIAPGTAAGDDG